MVCFTPFYLVLPFSFTNPLFYILVKQEMDNLKTVLRHVGTVPRPISLNFLCFTIYLEWELSVAVDRTRNRYWKKLERYLITPVHFVRHFSASRGPCTWYTTIYRRPKILFLQVSKYIFVWGYFFQYKFYSTKINKYEFRVSRTSYIFERNKKILKFSNSKKFIFPRIHFSKRGIHLRSTFPNGDKSFNIRNITTYTEVFFSLSCILQDIATEPLFLLALLFFPAVVPVIVVILRKTS